MLVCSKCGKGKNKLSYSRHKKGSSGAGGTWALRAPIHSRTQYANLHVYKGTLKASPKGKLSGFAYKGQKYCTKCLRVVKGASRTKPVFKATSVEKQGTPAETPVAA